MNAFPDPARNDAFTDLGSAAHRRLAYFNGRRLRAALPDAQWAETLRHELSMSLIEGRFIEAERRAVQAAAEEAPTDPNAFIAWFETALGSHPAQDEELLDWLAGRASLTDIHWFLEQEAAAEAGLETLVALTRLHMPPAPKLAMRPLDWDEFARSRWPQPPAAKGSVWESLALANLMLGLAVNRRYSYQSVGALAAAEQGTAAYWPSVEAGLSRLGQDARARSECALRAGAGAAQLRDWSQEVIRPLLGREEAVQRAIAEGALMRLGAKARCFARYRRALMPFASELPSQRPPLRGDRLPLPFR